MTLNEESFKRLLLRYDYKLPKELIAQKPAHPRDAAKLLVYNRATKKISEDIFHNIYKYLPRRAILVLNDTKVIPARFTLRKETGGIVRVLFLKWKGGLMCVLSQRKLTTHSKLFLGAGYFFQVTRRSGKYYFLKPLFSESKLKDVFDRYGQTPLPPYIKPSLSEKKLRKEYQTVFATKEGSVAAPTASLHFTKELLRILSRSGFDIQFITLHVNLGTFAPLLSDQLKKGALHPEIYEIPAATAKILNRAKKEGRPIVAVGTTVARTLETASDKKGKLVRLHGTTKLFIRGAYHFKFVNVLITNFHVPRSSLLMLVAAFVGRKKIFKLYKLAIKRKFRFFSFGDGMLVS